MRDRVGVLGASGYVGGAVASVLRNRGYDVAPAAGSSHETYPTVDLRDRAAVRSFVADVDAVVNAAGLVGTDACAERPDDAFEINGTGAATVAWACARRDVPVVHLSSVATIGRPETVPLTADSERIPETTYGHTKLLGERAVRTVTDGRVPSVTFCLSNPYGSLEETTLGDSVVDFFLERALAGEALPVHRPGTQERDLVHVRDVADAMAAAVGDLLSEADPVARTYVLGSGESYSVLEVAGLIAAARRDLVGSSPDLELRERPSSAGPVLERFAVDPASMRSDLGVEPTRDLERWVREVLEARDASTAAQA
ncbi:NAD-dependent epimerase/dehydratase family protein [Halopiger goleimassiliensis]|uniref:NAD-dependent epimerase/dehydratase family protein n=1 Tax=Halopiger goleimassiliensis TaxID=1293048 RepID=UPI0006783154|nr:NAD-dependent epimerase/dehydratase family protein [Halopiger goleimassiliensis]